MRKYRALACCVIGAATVSSVLAAESFLGRWAVTPAACQGQGGNAATAPLVATGAWLTWFDGPCRIGKMYKAGHAVYLQAHCPAKGDVPVTLNASGDRMRVTWGNARFEEMRRCK
jgi:hypothetical protein